VYSSGEWLMPSRLGTKIIPVGTCLPTSIASWPAPLGILRHRAPSAIAARSTVSTIVASSSSGSSENVGSIAWSSCSSPAILAIVDSMTRSSSSTASGF
jgi:cytochrome c oxidase assembly factor CtaG